MATHVCYHCKEEVEDGAPHDCWTTTEAALTADLPEDLREAWERLRATAEEFGEQRIYASHHCIMFSRKAAYFFVRPKRNALEVVIFLGRLVKAPQVRRTARASQTKIGHVVQITHRDEVEAPISDWLREAYESSDRLSVRAAGTPSKAGPVRKAGTASKKPAAKRTRASRPEATTKIRKTAKKPKMTKPASKKRTLS
jgi:Domain of unknown function (DUF5655)